MAEVRLRKPTSEDFEAVFALLKQLWLDAPLDRARLQGVFIEGLSLAAVEYRVAELNGLVVGFGSLVMNSSLWAAGHLAQVNELVVDEAYRGRGIGTQLLDALIEAARQRSCRRLQLGSSFHRHEAHRFYEARGFGSRALLFSRDL